MGLGKPWGYGTRGLWEDVTLERIVFRTMRLWNKENRGQWDFWITRLLDQVTWRLCEFMTSGPLDFGIMTLRDHGAFRTKELWSRLTPNTSIWPFEPVWAYLAHIWHKFYKCNLVLSIRYFLPLLTPVDPCWPLFGPLWPCLAFLAPLLRIVDYETFGALVFWTIWLGDHGSWRPQGFWNPGTVGQWDFGAMGLLNHGNFLIWDHGTGSPCPCRLLKAPFSPFPPALALLFLLFFFPVPFLALFGRFLLRLTLFVSFCFFRWWSYLHKRRSPADRQTGWTGNVFKIQTSLFVPPLLGKSGTTNNLFDMGWDK